MLGGTSRERRARASTAPSAVACTCRFCVRERVLARQPLLFCLILCFLRVSQGKFMSLQRAVCIVQSLGDCVAPWLCKDVFAVALPTLRRADLFAGGDAKPASSCRLQPDCCTWDVACLWWLRIQSRRGHLLNTAELMVLQHTQAANAGRSHVCSVRAAGHA